MGIKLIIKYEKYKLEEKCACLNVVRQHIVYRLLTFTNWIYHVEVFVGAHEMFAPQLPDSPIF